jgi:hypothetical protein
MDLLHALRKLRPSRHAATTSLLYTDISIGLNTLTFYRPPTGLSERLMRPLTSRPTRARKVLDEERRDTSC